MVQETLFLSLFHTEWCRKRCFCLCYIRNGAVNVVSFIIPYGMMQETLFLSLLHTEWCRKRCFFLCSIRNGAGNVVSFIIPYGMMQETLFLSLLHTEWCRKRCFFLCSIRNGAGNVVSNSTPVESAEALSPYLNLLRNLSMLFLLTRNFLTFSKSVSKTFCVPSLICNSQNTITL